MQLDGTLVAGAVAVLAIALAVAHQYLFTFRFWSSRGIKGPFPWPFIGTNVYYIFKNKIELDGEWHERFGKTFGIYEGTQPVLRTIDNQLIKQVYIKEFSSFTDRATRLVVGDMRRWLLFSPGPLWANQRALITPLFTSARMRNMFAPMLDCAQRYLAMVHHQRKQLGANGGGGAGKGGNLLLCSKDELMSLALDVIATTFFSLKLDTYRDKTSEFFRKAFALSSFSKPRFLLWMFTPRFVADYFKFDVISYHQYEYFDKLSQRIINEHRRESEANKSDQEGGGGKRVDFIKTLLEAQLPAEHVGVHTAEDNLLSHYNDRIDHNELDRIHREQSKAVRFTRFDDASIRAQATLFFLAGFDTTSTALSLVFYELAHQQAAQAEVYAELVGANAHHHHQLDYEHLMGLKKLDAFISEAMRLWTPVTEHARTSTNKGGAWVTTCAQTDGRPSTIHLPQGTGISVSVYQLQRHPDYWAEPNEFQLGRFYSENRDRLMSCTYAPFGIGPRNCVGMRFALMNMKCLLAKVLLQYQVRPAPNSARYPPQFKFNPFFIQLKHSDFVLAAR